MIIEGRWVETESRIFSIHHDTREVIVDWELASENIFFQVGDGIFNDTFRELFNGEEI